MNRLGKLKAHERTHTPPDHRMRDTALALFGAGALEEIEGILRVASPDEQVRDYLARSLHAYARVKYARDTGDRTVGDGAGSPAQIRQRVKAIDKAARSLRAALVPTDNAATSTVAIMLMAGDVNVGLLNKQVDATIAALEKVEISKGGGRPLDDPEHWLLMDRIADLFELTAQRQARLKDSTLGLPVGRVFSGDFFRMAELVEAAAAEAKKLEPMTNSALGTQLRRLLDLRAKLRANG
jgi:hypothetical protein